MNDQHLTDDQIQGYLDRSIGQPGLIEAHLESCPRCRQALVDYEALYSGLNLEPELGLSANFADSVLAKIPEPIPVPDEKVAKRYTVRDSVFVFAAFAAALAAMLYMFEPGKLLKWFTGVSDLSFLAGIKMPSFLQEYISVLNNTPMMLVFIVLTIAAIAVIDHAVAQRKHHQKTASIVV
jgi:hypothetical protein